MPFQPLLLPNLIALTGFYLSASSWKNWLSYWGSQTCCVERCSLPTTPNLLPSVPTYLPPTGVDWHINKITRMLLECLTSSLLYWSKPWSVTTQSHSGSLLERTHSPPNQGTKSLLQAGDCSSYSQVIQLQQRLIASSSNTIAHEFISGNEWCVLIKLRAFAVVRHWSSITWSSSYHWSRSKVSENVIAQQLS